MLFNCLKFWKGKHYKIKFIAFLESLWTFFLNLLGLLEKRAHISINKTNNEVTNFCQNYWLLNKETRNDSIFNITYLQKKEYADYHKLIDRKFSILSSNISYKNNKIEWHRDFLSNKQWKIKYYKKLYPLANVLYNDDCKVPWELSRFQHFPTMAKAYLQTGDSQYLKESVWQINDWINENPCPYGINWTCAMEVAIRACNWIWAWWAFNDSVYWTQEFNNKFLKSMWQHGWYIEHNLENKNGIKTNHYLSDIVGLLFIGIMFPQFKDAERWKNFGLKELIKCMEEMTYKDGFSFENSTAYHRLILELFTYSSILCYNNDIQLPSEFWVRLELMFEFILHIMRPDGCWPMVGDSDDGRFFILTDYYKWERFDFKYLLAIGSVIFNRNDFLEAAKGHIF